MLTVSVQGQTGVENSALVYITTLPADLQAHIAEGNRLFSTADGTLLLDGSASKDPDFTGSTDSALEKHWSCTMVPDGGNCFPPDVESALFTNSKTLSVAASNLWTTGEGEAFVFTLRVQKQERSAEYSVKIKVTNLVVPIFSVAANFVGKMDPKKSLQLKAHFPPSIDTVTEVPLTYPILPYRSLTSP